MFCCIVGITIVFAADAANHYAIAVCARRISACRLFANQIQIVGYLAAGLVMTTSAVSTLIYQNAGTMQAAAAGFILLSMISVRSMPCPPDANI